MAFLSGILIAEMTNPIAGEVEAELQNVQWTVNY